MVLDYFQPQDARANLLVILDLNNIQIKCQSVRNEELAKFWSFAKSQHKAFFHRSLVKVISTEIIEIFERNIEHNIYKLELLFICEWVNVKIWTIFYENIFCLSLLTFSIVAHFFIFNFGNGEENYF